MIDYTTRVPMPEWETKSSSLHRSGGTSNSDVNGLAFATVAGALGLGLLGAWIQDREGGR